MKNGGIVFSSTGKYRGRLFQIGTAWCSWQLGWDCSRNEHVCFRHVNDTLRDESLKRLEKSVWVPCPEMTADEKAAADNLFKMMKTSKAHQEKVIHMLLKDRWQKAAEVLCEKLAKADWEKYGKGKCE
jgi:hypothetical protein